MFNDQFVLGFPNRQPMIAAITINNSKTIPPQIPAAVKDAPSPFNAISSFGTTFWLPSSNVHVHSS